MEKNNYFYTFKGKKIGIDGIYEYTLINEEKYKSLKNNMNQYEEVEIKNKGEKNGNN